MTHSHADISETRLQQSSREIRAGGLELSDGGSGIHVITHWHTEVRWPRSHLLYLLKITVDWSSARKWGIIVMRVNVRDPLSFICAPACCCCCSPVVSRVLALTLTTTGNGANLLPLQVRRMRRCVPRRVSAESSAVSSLRSPRTPPQEAVALPVSWWRRLLPAVPRHLRTHEHAATGRDRWLRWTKGPD